MEECRADIMTGRKANLPMEFSTQVENFSLILTAFKLEMGIRHLMLI